MTNKSSSNDSNPQPKTRKPKIGLVLGSGSARGWAHIGVIEELESLGIHADIVVGCSIGSLVGAAYSANETQALKDWVLELRMIDVMSFMDLTFKTGFVDAHRLFGFFQEQFGAVQIEDLDKPFATVATELVSGREIWFREGLLIPAIRASSALPGLFAPLDHEGDFLVDGGLVNPVPISLARAMGADLVIAVNLNAEIVGKRFKKNNVADEDSSIKKDEGTESTFMAKVSEYFGASGKSSPPGFMEVMASSINIMQDRITRSRMAGDPAEVLVTPRLAHFGMMEFNRAEEAIEEGRASVQRILPQLESYGLIDELTTEAS